jgi:hypothetical protein
MSSKPIKSGKKFTYGANKEKSSLKEGKNLTYNISIL